MRLNTTTKVVIKRKSRKRRYVRVEKTLIVSKVLDLITKREGSRYKKGEKLAKRIRVGRRYSYYSKIRYNSRTYKVEIKDIDNSNKSKE